MRYFIAPLFGLVFSCSTLTAQAAQKIALLGVPIGATEGEFLPEFRESQFECVHKTEFEVECKRGKEIPRVQSVQHLHYLLTSSQPARVYSVRFDFKKISLKPTDVINQISETYGARPSINDPSEGCLAANRCHALWLLDGGLAASLNSEGPSSEGIYHYQWKILHVATATREMGVENPFDAVAKKLNGLKNALEQDGLRSR